MEGSHSKVRMAEKTGMQFIPMIGLLILVVLVNMVINPLDASHHLCNNRCRVAFFKSTDGGETWQHQTGTPKRSTFYVLAIDPTMPDTLYAARGYSQMTII